MSVFISPIYLRILPFLFIFLTAAGADNRAGAGPATPNPGLHYYYEIPQPKEPQVLKIDICVYGGTPGGVGAAVQARRMGRAAALAGHRRDVGGVTGAGRTAGDPGHNGPVGGVAAGGL